MKGVASAAPPVSLMEMTSADGERMEASQPIYKRRCSLTMPYPALYGSWQATAATPVRSINLQRRWSTFQMDTELPQMINSELNREPVEQQQQHPPGSSYLVEKMDASMMDASMMDTVLDEETESVTNLIMCTFQRLPLKDFGCEVRPALDVALFINQSVLLIDVEAPNSPTELVDLLLASMVKTPELVQEAKMILFTHDSGQLALANQFPCNN